jgi:hypothetical protein
MTLTEDIWYKLLPLQFLFCLCTQLDEVEVKMEEYKSNHLEKRAMNAKKIEDQNAFMICEIVKKRKGEEFLTCSAVIASSST